MPTSREWTAHYDPSDLAAVDPGERGRRLCGDPLGDLTGEELLAFGLLAQVILGAGRLARDRPLRDVPRVVQVGGDGGVILDGVDPGALGDVGEMLEEVGVLTVEHH